MMPMMIDARMKARTAEDQGNDADNRGVHAQGARQAIDKVATGVGQGTEDAAEAVDDKTDDGAERLAQPFEKAFYLHVHVMMRRWACLCLWLLITPASSLQA